ncbi:MAG: HNH endonuclease [Planctomycetes bacterium]|nr:HNH endonuclease [Planctomycetota bacterium]
MNGFAMSTCIYCLKQKGSGDFNREHVVPKSFGHYTTNSPIIRCVCNDCNSYFGNTHDRILARDSWEGFNRYLAGIKPLDEIANFARRRVVFTSAVPGEWHGVKLRLISDANGLAVEPVPQVGMLNGNTQKWEFYTSEELDILPSETIDHIRGALELKVFFHGNTEKSQVIDALGAKNIPFEEKTILPHIPLDRDGYGEVEVKYSFDLLIHRAICKIAFNFLAWRMDRDFVLRDDFNDVRDFVRDGKLPEPHIVCVTSEPIFLDDSVTIRQTDGHIITLNWSRRTLDIISKVSLFNHLTYEVVLSRNYSGPWRPDLRVGRLFEHRNGSIREVHATSLL